MSPPSRVISPIGTVTLKGASETLPEFSMSTFSTGPGHPLKGETRRDHLLVIRRGPTARSRSCVRT